MELSSPKILEAKKLGVTVQYLVYADLMAIGYSENDAYVIAFPENVALSEYQNNSIKKNILSSAKFKKILEIRRSRVKDGTATPYTLEEMELVGTEEVLKEILRSAKQQAVGSKERAELYAKYNDIKRESEMSGTDGTDSINFFLPLKCNQCPLLHSYNQYLKENNLKEIRPVEMGKIAAAAHNIIQASKEGA